jgi:hypothetical protein
MPNQYTMEEEELDEFVLNGDEDMMLDVNPDSLPKMVSLRCVRVPCLALICWLR